MSVRAAVSRRVRSGVRRRLEAVLDRVGLVEPRPAPAENRAAPAPVVEASAPVIEPEAAEPEATEPDAAEPEAAEPEGLTREVVQEIFDDMVRPALQMDGGDITLIDVKGGDVYVQLIGACNGCPSSTMTLRDGIERLLEEELPQFRQLVPVDGPTP